MRHEADTYTAELPGIPELPPAPPKTTQAQRIAELGYQGPKERQRCENCSSCTLRILNPDALNEVELLRCDLGDFPVLRGGICGNWSPA